MPCPSCQAPSEPDARFCESCGAALEAVCNSCGGSLSPGASYCRHCGTATGEAAAAAEATAERRQITAMFCDLEDSTALSSQLDLEELRDVVTSYQAVCTRVARRFGGHVAQFLGDGVLVYFGFPRSHEDDAERAVRAGLALQEALADADRRRSLRGGPRVHARVGIHTGVVVLSPLGLGLRRETLALGETINLAAHLQALAPPGGVVISRATRQLIGASAVTEEIPSAELARLGPQLVLSISAASRRYAAAPSQRGALPMIGRDAELATLLACWGRVRDGIGQVVSVTGDAGIGKTRLIASLRERIGSSARWLEIGCSAFHSGTAFHPVLKLLEQGFGFTAADGPDARLEKLEATIARWRGVTPESCVPFLAKLLGLPASARYPLPPMSAQLERERTLEALLAPVFADFEDRPVVVVVEDLHWCDRSTLELVDSMIARAASHPVLVVGSFRPAFFSRWARHGERTHVVALARLTDGDTRAVVELTAGDVRLPPPVVSQIVSRASGVPLFAQELTRSQLEAHEGADASPQSGVPAVPTTLRGSLMERLDRLGSAKLVAQVGATLGREFSAAMVAAVAELDDEGVARELERLVAAGVLERRASAGGETVAFTHVLVQEIAYDSQLRSRRRELHARAARVLEARFAGTPAAEPEVLARHYAEAGDLDRAIDRHAEAGRLAMARLANAEAIDHFAAALDLLATLPESPRRDQREALLRIAQAGPLATTGYDRAETIANQQRLEALAERASGPGERLPILTGLATFHQLRGDLPRARHWAEQLLRVAEPLGVKPLCVAGHAILGAASIASVTVPLACEHLARADELAREALLPPPVTAIDIDTQVLVSGVRSLAQVLNGETSAGLERCESGLRRARELGHHYTQAHALSNAAILAYFVDDAARAAELAREGVRFSEGRGFHVPESVGRVFGGWARVLLGDSGGLADVERGLAIALRAGSRGGLVQLHIAAAEAHLASGNHPRCEELIDQTAAMMVITGERTSYEPQLLALRAELLLAAGEPQRERVERLLLDSIEGWRAYRSRWMELRSAMLLGELALRDGDAKGAYGRIEELLRELAGQAPTPRVARARALLDSLAERTAQ